jgi:co-chaperonin GroES (HSP10)
MSPIKTVEGSRVFFKLPEVKTVTDSGIHLPEEALAEQAAKMEEEGVRVYAHKVGPDCVFVKEGDQILLDNHHIPVFTLNGERYSCVYEHTIAAVIETEAITSDDSDIIA